ncbi:sec-independent translocase [Propioniciclava sp.]|uniref:sec-independent translocase n=1 Tax=Propioniciclava sp. TaxID=2038686 RepID=UPI00261BB0D9|nr:sec-independent translocase [Propioniciclava sp.]
MIDFNFWEIGGLIVLAILIFGPDKLPELARKTARVINYLREIGNDARGQLRKELGPEFDDIRLSDLNPKTFVQRHLLSGDEIADLRQIRDDALDAGTLVKETVTEARDDINGLDQKKTQAEPAASVTVPFDPEAT